MRGTMIDFSSWSSILTTVLSLLVITLLMVGIRLVFMQTIQRRRERENRQINERLKTLIAAYKVLGGSFTGELAVSPVHLREVHLASRRSERSEDTSVTPTDLQDDEDGEIAESPAISSNERQRRTRDVVEAALSDIILLGTEEQVDLAAQAARDMVAGRSIETAQLVTSLRQFVRAALDLEPIPERIAIPNQGPARANAGGPARGIPGGGNAGGSRAGGGGGGASGIGMGVGMGLGGTRRSDPDQAP